MREAEGGDELSEAEESSSEEERIHYEVAGKLLRFFTHADDDYFYLFLVVRREANVPCEAYL
jgi:hypothetical protein